MEVSIRECITADAEAVYSLNKTELGYDYPIEQTRKKLAKILTNRENKILVAVCNENVVGYVHSNDYDVIYAPQMKNIMGIAVSKDYQRQGIGKMLLDAVEHWAKQTGADGIRLVSGATRMSAHSFYQKCGYDTSKHQINFKKFLNN